MGRPIARFEQLVEIIGEVMAQCVCAKLAGKRITIGKKHVNVRTAYLQRRAYYEAMPVKLAAKLLRCTVRYYKALKADRRGV